MDLLGLAGIVTGFDMAVRAPEVPVHPARGIMLGFASVLETAAAWADGVDLAPATTPRARPLGRVSRLVRRGQVLRSRSTLGGPARAGMAPVCANPLLR